MPERVGGTWGRRCGTRSEEDRSWSIAPDTADWRTGAGPHPFLGDLGSLPPSPLWGGGGSTQVGVESERKPELGGFTDLALGPCACPPGGSRT